MKRKLKFLFSIFFTVVICALGKSSQAHIMGAELFYKCLGNGKYLITVKAYQHCQHIQVSQSPIVAKCGTHTITILNQTQLSVRDITGIDSSCDFDPCQGSTSFDLGVEEYVWQATLDLSAYTCCDWEISWEQGFRSGNISTGMGGENYHTYVKLNKCLASCNSSPVYSVLPPIRFCYDQPVLYYNLGAIDTVDPGDSFSYELAPAYKYLNQAVTYSSNFSYLRPLTFWGFPNHLPFPLGFHLNASTGDLSFVPKKLNEIAVVVIQVNEFRKDSTGTWVKIGETRRDMEVRITDCTLSGGGGTGGGGGGINYNPSLQYTANPTLCAGDSTCMTITATDDNSDDTVRLSWNNGIPGAGFTITNPGKKIDTAMVCWRPGEGDTSSIPYSFIVFAKDKVCPLPGTASRLYSFTVRKKPRTEISYTTDTCGVITLTSSPLATYDNPQFQWVLSDSAKDTVFHSTQQNTFAFLEPGKYYVYHKITTAHSCLSEYNDSVFVDPYPVIRTSSINDTTVCSGTLLSLASTVSGGVSPLSYYWNTGPADTLPTLNMKPESDTLLIITVVDKNQCYHSDTVGVQVKPSPKAGFSVADTAQCLSGNSFIFKNDDTSQTGPVNYTWHFGDGNTATTLSATKSYSSADTFAVLLVADNEHTCYDTAVHSVAVHPQPQADISFSDTSLCFRGNSFDFSGSASSVSSGSIAEYKWKLGDVDTTSGMDVTSKSYAGPGTYQVQLKVLSDKACVDSVILPLSVHPQISAAIAAVDSTQCLSGNLFSFDASPSGISVGNIASYVWDYGDGETAGSVTPAAKHYITHDSFTVKLTLVSDQGCTDSTQLVVVVYPQPAASFSINDSIQCFDATQNFSFDASASSVPSPWGNIDSYDWFLSDGDYAQGVTYSSKSFASRNKYDVKLVVSSDKGCTDSITKQLSFYPEANVLFNVNDADQCFNEQNFVFDASASSISSGSLMQYDWKYGDNTLGQGTFPPSKTFDTTGTFEVWLVVTSNEGCPDSLKKEVNVFPSPVADFEVAATCFKQASVFQDKSSLAEGSITTWTWDLGDGKQSLDQNPTYFYGGPGEYTVTLTIADDNNCTHDTVKTNVAQVKSLPEAQFGYKQKAFDYSNTLLQYLDESVDAQHWNWDFGNGAQSKLQNPEHSYTDTGTFSVQLIVENAAGCFDTSLQVIFVAPDFLFYIPNSFSPNGDELNEGFGAEGSIYLKKSHFKIFNRWGQIIFESKTPGAKWDGKYLGKECPDGVYVYLYNLTDIHGENHVYKGNFYLVR